MQNFYNNNKVVIFLDLNTIKNYLKIDFDDDDELINMLIAAAKEYIVNAIGNFDENKATHRLLLLNIVANLYENRSFLNSKNNEKVAYIIKSLITQLQLSEVDVND